uniref:Fibronectin type III domain-containing protein 1-like n=1 Tax=Crassostrea virginica TaxID=6565 RepID=A0A8B8DD62_CRAVI|nr:fibronectin type III domain-containing protein 1-like [Crassostrea virginica]
MWNLLGLTVMAVSVFVHQLSAQQQQRLTAINGHLEHIIGNAKILPAVIQAPSRPRNVQIELSRLDPSQLTIYWIPPYHTYGPLTNYTLHWGVKNEALRKEKIEPFMLRWDSDYLDDATVYEFKLFAVNAGGFGEPAIVQFTTPKQETIVPPNVTMDHVKGPNNTTMVRVKWDPPNQPVEGYRIVYRKLERVYTGRWRLKELNDPNALSTEIVLDEPIYLQTVVVYGITKRQKLNFQMMGQMNQQMMGSLVIQAPSEPRNVQIELSRLDPPQLTIYWIPPYDTYGPLTNYTLHWGVKNGALRKEKIEPYRLRWDSDYLDDATDYEFKLFAVNAGGFGEPVIVQFTTPKPEIIVPPNVTVDRLMGPNNTTMERVKWDPPNQPVEGYTILYRKFEWVYTGRWKLKELNDPNALSTEIVVDDPKYSNIVVVRGTPKRQNSNFPMMGQMNQQMLSSFVIQAPSEPRNVQIELSRLDPPQLTIYWIPPYHTYGPLTNYTLHWGVKNGALRKEKIEPYRLRWDSDYLDDATDYEFKLFAVNAEGFGEPVIVQFTTPKRKTIDPPNVTVDRVKGPNNTTMVRVKWDPPNQPVEGYTILYRKFEWVSTGRWKIKEMNDPNALTTEIVVDEPLYSHIVVVRGTVKPTPSEPRNVQIELSRLDPPQLTIHWIPPYHTYGPLTNYTLHWGVKNRTVREEKIEPYRLRWDSDYLDDGYVHEFKLFAVNPGGFGEPAIVQFTTPKRETIVPPNITVDRVKGPNNTTMLRLKWDPPNQPVEGYIILHRKFEWVYTGRWKLTILNDPNALSTDIALDDPKYSYISVVRGALKRQNPNFPMMGQMNHVETIVPPNVTVDQSSYHKN